MRKYCLLATLLFSGIGFCQTSPSLYEVKQGDTLARIALNNRISPMDLASWNGISESQGIVVGQILSLSPTSNIPGKQLAQVSPAPIFVWPIKGKVIKGFGDLSKGISISGNIGDPVVASADGKVVYSGNTLKGFGNLVIVKHDNTFLTVYAQNSKLLVNEGASVLKGDKIAEVGMFESSVPQLYFEIRSNGTPVNPEPYLNGLVSSQKPSSPESKSMDEFKSKCKELGFNAGTEGFGKCVLKLSK